MAKTLPEKPTLALPIVRAADPFHLHGRLGIRADGKHDWVPRPKPQHQTDQEKTNAHRGYAFNSKVCESIALDRDIPDTRPKQCPRRYTAALPRASVIIVFHNEALCTLIRQVRLHDM